MTASVDLPPLVAQRDRAAFNGRVWRRLAAMALAFCTYIFFIHFYHDALGGIYGGLPRVAEAPFDLGALICILVAGAIVPTTLARPSSMVLIYALHGFFIPVFILLFVHQMDWRFYAVSLAAFVIMCLLTRLDTYEVADVPHGEKIGIVGIGAILIAIVAVYLSRAGSYGAFTLLDQTAMYAAREANIDVNPGLVYYLIGWASNLLNPVLLAYGVLKRRYSLVFIFLVLQVLMLIMSAEKRIALLPFILIAMLVIANYRRAAPYLVVFLIWTVTIIPWYLFETTGDVIAVSYLPRREFFGASMVAVFYYDVFDTIMSPIYWSASVLRFFSPYNYYLTPQVVVGQDIAFGGGSANNGMLGSGFMNAGFAGVLLYAFVIGLLMNLADSLVVKRMDMRIGTMLCYFPFMVAIAQSDFFPALLSGGLILLFPLLAVLGKRDYRLP